jgi:histone acetyltransferase 1
VTYQRDSYRPKPGTTFDEFPPPQIHPFELPNRSRISQFVIFPPSQGRGLGRHLYNTMFDEFLADPACIELTVEDPNEEFDDLRDYCDFARLTSNGTFSQLHLNASIDPKLTARRPGVRVPTAHLVDKSLFDQLRVRNKIQPRQWKRLVDMYLLSQIPKYSRQGGVARLTQRAKSSDPGDKAYYLWRLLVKQRIYVQNVSIMAQFDLPERIEKLEETLEGQVADYERLLSRIEEEQAKKDTESMESVTQEHNGEPPSQRNRKRVIEDEDSAEESEPKRARTAEVRAET